MSKLPCLAANIFSSLFIDFIYPNYFDDFELKKIWYDAMKYFKTDRIKMKENHQCIIEI